MKRSKTLKIILVIGDTVLLGFSLFATLSLRYWDFSLPLGPERLFGSFLVHFSIIYLVWLLFLAVFDFYNIPPIKSFTNYLRNLIFWGFFAGISGTIYFYLQPKLALAPKTILFLNVFIAALLITGLRFLIGGVLRTDSFKEKVVVVGFRRKLKKLLSSSLKNSSCEIVALFGEDFPEQVSEYARYGLVKNVSELKDVIKKEKVTSIVFASEFREDKKVINQLFSELPLQLNYLSFSTFYEKITGKVPVEALDEAWFLENISQPERRGYKIMKRVIDLITGTIGLLITIVLLPIIALAIKLDSKGPVFYTQERVGLNKEIFTVYKFRTMEANFNQHKQVWREKDKEQLTRVGRILRKTHLDEGPQFYNILKGNLSLVGPRAEWVKLVKKFEQEIPFYGQRFLVKPGLTGWAWINFPASKTLKEAKEKFEYDLYYIKNRSTALDVYILLKTLRTALLDLFGQR